MRCIRAIGSTGALVCVALAIGCVEVERVPVPIGYTNPPTAAVATSQPQPVVTGTVPLPHTESTVPEAPAPNAVVVPEAQGATESQPDGRTRAEQTMLLASQQVDRLRRMEKSGNDSAPREDVDAALNDLENQRGKVLQDLREVALRPSNAILAKLDDDVASLESAMRGSFAIAPPPSQGLPQPSPLTPSQASQVR
jgi:hypothetical protein